MALSSKKIIQHINTYKDKSFTSDNVISALIKPEKKEKLERKKKRKRPRNNKKDKNTIYSTLSTLLDIGFLTKKNKKYKKSKLFDNIGTISVTPKGKGVVDLEYYDIQIRRENINNAHSNDIVEIELLDIRKGIFYGKVNKIVERDRQHYFALVEKKSKGMIYYRLLDVPGNLYACSNRYRSEPKINDFVLIQLTGKQLGGNPECLVGNVSECSNEDFDIDRIILKHNLPSQKISFKELKDIENRVPESELINRKDLTDLLTVTIDGDTAKDFDDAISFEKKDNGYTLHVHIADVSAYVLPNSSIDVEALKRGTSYYLGNRVIPMLPEKLSNDLCSLREKIKRLSLTAIIHYNEKCHVTSFSFCRSYINVNKRLTYKIATKLIEQKKDDSITQMLIELDKFTTTLKENRLKNGRIDLQLTDPELIYNDNNFEDIVDSHRLKSHFIIEECMLSANEVVSKALRKNKIPALYRIHEDMSEEKVYALEKFLNLINIKFNAGTNTGLSLQQIVENISGSAYEHVVNFLILRSMMQAYYGIEPLGHFGLGFRDYTHFTSPIRRYPDLIVHRCLKTIIDKSDNIYNNKELSIIGEQTSKLERIAQKAERDLFKLKSCRLMQDYIGEQFTGIISGVSNFGIFVTLKEKPIEGMIPLSQLDDDYYIVIENEFSIVGKQHGKKYSLGNELNIKVIRSDIITMQIDFKIIK